MRDLRWMRTCYSICRPLKTAPPQCGTRDLRILASTGLAHLSKEPVAAAAALQQLVRCVSLARGQHWLSSPARLAEISRHLAICADTLSVSRTEGGRSTVWQPPTSRPLCTGHPAGRGREGACDHAVLAAVQSTTDAMRCGPCCACETAVVVHSLTGVCHAPNNALVMMYLRFHMQNRTVVIMTEYNATVRSRLQ